jgi:hypothetical protein
VKRKEIKMTKQLPASTWHFDALMKYIQTDPEDSARLCIYVDLEALQHCSSLDQLLESHRIILCNYANSIETATGITVPLHGKGEDFSNDMIVRASLDSLYQLSLPAAQLRDIMHYTADIKEYECAARADEC